MPTRSRFAAMLLALFVLDTGPLAAGSWTIPGVVNTSGLNGTRFASDLSLTNTGAATVAATLSFLQSSPLLSRSVTLSPGQTLVYRNAADALFAASGVAGAVSITSSESLLVRARTYNTAANGTFGVALPVFEDERLLTAGETGDSLWVSQDASGSSGFRTNIAVVFPDDGGGQAAVTVYDSDGNVRGSKDFVLDAAGFQQFSVGSFAGAVPVGRAQVVVTRGRAAGYAVVVDNVTGDSSLFTFDDLPGGIQDVLVNGVARASGRNNAFFRTDGRFYNPTDTDATVAVSFHAAGNANLSPAKASFTLPAGTIRDVVDVLDSLLGLPVGSAGALRFQSDWPVAILCRTSNVDPAGVRPGTFGSQQKPVPVLSFLTSADAGAAITGIRQDASFRTNVGFAAGGDGARYSLTLSNASGGTIATASGSLGAWGWSQPNVQDLFPGSSVPADATLQVKVTEGSLDVFDSSIDNASGDPVVTPIAPLPVAIPSSATIGPQGGSIRSSDGRLTLRIPAGALSQAVTLSIEDAPSDAPLGVGAGYQILPAGVTFAKPALLTFGYRTADIEGSSAGALSLALKGSSGWYVMGGGSTDTGAQTLTARIGATSPSAAQSASVGLPRPAADPVIVWSVVVNWRLVPSGRLAVLTDGRLDLAAYSLMPNGLPEVGPLVPISRSPGEVTATWYVNDIVRGDLVNGVVTSTGGMSATYIPPRCPPPRNPVVIRFVVANNLIPQVAARGLGRARVRVLPRKWKMKVDPVAFGGCNATWSVSDSVHWTDPYVEFTLDDNLRGFAEYAFAPGEHSRNACQTCPSGYTASVVDKGGGDLPLRVSLQAAWNTDLDELEVVLRTSYEGPQDLWFRCTRADGQFVDTRIAPDEVGFGFFDHLFAEPGETKAILEELFPGDPRTIFLNLSLRGVCP